MEIALSVGIIAKSLGFVILSVFLAAVTLFPINDKPTSAGQVAFFVLAELFFFAWIFGFVSFTVTT